MGSQYEARTQAYGGETQAAHSCHPKCGCALADCALRTGTGNREKAEEKAKGKDVAGVSLFYPHAQGELRRKRRKTDAAFLPVKNEECGKKRKGKKRCLSLACLC